MALFDDASLVVTPNGYKAGTLYSIKPTSGAGDMTVVRATTATRVNSAGLIESVANNVPRLDYSNGTCPSLLVEPQRTNVLTQSEGVLSTYGLFDNVTNASSSFNSFLNAIQIPISGLSYSYKGATLTLSQIYTLSFFVKMDDNSAPVLTASSSTGNFNLVGENNGIVTDNLQVISIGNNVYRVSGTLTGTGNSNNFGMVRFTTQVLKSFKMSAIQLEAGSYPTSYIPTTSAAVTRNGDAIYKTGISALIGQTEGTLFLYADIQKHNESDFYIAISNGASLGDAIYLYQPSSGNIQILTRKTGNADGTITIANANWTAGLNKVAIAYTATTIEVFINGVSKGSTTFTALPTLSQLTIGSRPDVVGTLVGTGIYSEAVVFPTRLTNAELATLTTI